MAGKKHRRTRLTIEEIREALLKCGGLHTHASRILGVGRTTVTARVSKSKILKDAVIEAREGLLDLAESKLVSCINNGELGAICFFLKCQGKDRGYVEKQSIVHSGDPENPLLNVDKTLEFLTKLATGKETTE